MADFTTLSIDELKKLEEELAGRHSQFKDLGLDMTRGKPSSEQLDLANEMISILDKDDYKDAKGTDCRNYGGIDGLAECKAIFAEFLEVETSELLMGGNASLQLMHDAVVRALLKGVPDGDKPWSKYEKIKFLCPSPGYDRHFAICEHYGIEMILVDTKEDGPDMDQVEKLVLQDDSIKGMWCVPKYGNPTGIVYSDKVIERMAQMKAAAKDFRIFYDNAYAVHYLGEKPAVIKNILKACKDAGNANRVLIFGSTSKITFAGSGLSCMGASEENIKNAIATISKQTIGPDKLNMLRHVRFFKDMNGILAHMEKHAKILRPKFEVIKEIFHKELEGSGIAQWTDPEGGYFVSMDVLDGCASVAVALAGEAGVKLTGAGATFPYNKDPRDRNFRIAPTLPPYEEVKTAMEVVAICIQLACVRKLIADK